MPSAAAGAMRSAPARSRTPGRTTGATCTGSFADGSSVALAAAPMSGYTFSGWDLGCTSVNAARDECTIGPDTGNVTTAGSFTMP